MTDEELRHRKRLQAGISVTTASLGLAALGTRAGAGVARRTVKNPVKARRIANSLNSHSTGLLTTSAGIGGYGGFNFAAIQRAEAKRDEHIRPRKVQKNWDKWNLEHKGHRPDPLVRRYGLRGELPDHLSSDQKREIWEARDKHLNRRRNRWERVEQGSLTARVAGDTVAGGVGTAATLGAIRAAYEKENPGKLAAWSAGKGKYARAIAHGNPNWKVLAAGAGATGVAVGAKQLQRHAAKKKEKYSTREGGTAAGTATRLKKSAFGVVHE